MPRERLVVPVPCERIIEEDHKSESPPLDPEDRKRMYGLASIVGQRQAIEKLRALATLHATRGRLPGPILLVGADGMGKRTMARAFATEMTSAITEADATTVEKPVDLMGLLVSLEERSVFILSNIGNMRKAVREFLLPAVTDYNVDIVLDKGVYARTINYTLKPFTLIATARTVQDCPLELSDIFLPPIRLEPYSNVELAQICIQIAEKSGISITSGAAGMVADSSRRSPHRTEILLRRLVATGNAKIDEGITSEILSVLGLRAPAKELTANASRFDMLSGIEFERVVTGLLERMGFHTEMTKASGDGGIDIVATLNRPIVGGRYIIQCKRYALDCLVGAPIVREFYGALTADRGAVKGILISTSGFTSQAQEFARDLSIELIGHDQLQQLLADYGVGSSDFPPLF